MQKQFEQFYLDLPYSVSFYRASMLLDRFWISAQNPEEIQFGSRVQRLQITNGGRVVPPRRVAATGVIRSCRKERRRGPVGIK